MNLIVILSFYVLRVLYCWRFWSCVVCCSLFGCGFWRVNVVLIFLMNLFMMDWCCLCRCGLSGWWYFLNGSFVNVMLFFLWWLEDVVLVFVVMCLSLNVVYLLCCLFMRWCILVVSLKYWLLRVFWCWLSWCDGCVRFVCFEVLLFVC